MRTYGRIYASEQDRLNGVLTWVEVDPDPATGLTDMIYATTLIQVLKLSLGESPFYANYGIPAQQSVLTQVYPDFYMARTQQQFSIYFASLIISRAAPPVPAPVIPVPTYNAKIVTHQGVILNLSTQVPV